MLESRRAIIIEFILALSNKIIMRRYILCMVVVKHVPLESMLLIKQHQLAIEIPSGKLLYNT